mgnify:CR=1 FL=1
MESGLYVVVCCGGLLVTKFTLVLFPVRQLVLPLELSPLPIKEVYRCVVIEKLLALLF